MKIIDFSNQKAVVHKDDGTHFFTAYTYEGWISEGNRGCRIPNFLSKNKEGELSAVTNLDCLTIHELDKIGRAFDGRKDE